MRHIILVLLIFSSSIGFADEIWVPHLQTQIDRDTFDVQLKESQLVVVGENHYDPEIVAVEASIVQQLNSVGPTTLGWEFLNLVDAEKVASTVSSLKNGRLTAEQGLEVFFPNAAAIDYKSLFEVIANTDADLIPTNLTRAQKSPVTAGGIGAAIEGTVPPGFEMGSDAYLERFVAAMGGHSVTTTMQNYFASQSLTDDVMAYSLLQNPAERRVLVTGSFHGDYRDGAVARLEARTGASVLYIKVVQKSDFEGQDLSLVMNDPKYGPIADILYLVDAKVEDGLHSGKKDAK